MKYDVTLFYSNCLCYSFLIFSLVNVQKRVSQGLKVLQYYTTRDWIFKNENFIKLYQEMNEVDKEKFYCDLKQIEIKDYLKNYIIGTRHYLLKDTPESLPKARKLLRRWISNLLNFESWWHFSIVYFRLYYLDQFVAILFYGLIFYFLWNYFGGITSFFIKSN